MLKQRLLTAAIGIPTLLLILIYSPAYVVLMFIMGCVAFSVFELTAMLLPALDERFTEDETADTRPIEGRGRFWQWFCVGIALIIFLISTMGSYEAGRGGIVLGMSVLMMVAVFSAKTVERSLVRMTGFLVSIAYACLPWLSVWDLYLMRPDAQMIVLLIVVVMSADSGAYFGGRHFGKTPLAPKLSPKKTWEGVFFGVIAAAVGAMIVSNIYENSLGPWWLMIIIAVAGAATGVMGDLIESALKRFAGVKDSGNVFPGHGGFLDRVDGLLFVAPVLWFILFIYPKVA